MGLNALDYRWQMVRGRWPLRVKNSFGSVIPPFSVVKVSSTSTSNNEILYTVTQPTATRGLHLVTGPFQIGAGSSAEGLATSLFESGLVQYDSSGTPSLTDSWGPKNGQFSLTKGAAGFIISGSTTTAAGTNVVPCIKNPSKMRVAFTASSVSCSVSATNTVITGGVLADSTSGGEFSVSGDNLAVNLADSTYRYSLAVSGGIVPTRNQHDYINFKVQQSTNGGSVFTDTIQVYSSVQYPDVAVPGFGGANVYNYGSGMASSVFVLTTITHLRLVYTAASTTGGGGIGTLGTNSFTVTLRVWNG